MFFDEMKDEIERFSKECSELKLGDGIGSRVNNLYIQVYRDSEYGNLFDIHTRSVNNNFNIVDDELGVHITDLTSELYKIAFNGKQFHVL